MSYSNLTFCWNGIVSRDPAKTVAFFPEVVGWTAQEVDMGDGPVQMFSNGETPLAHIRTPMAPEEPSWWNNYLRVEDVDAATAAVTAQGGTVVVPPTDIQPGRFSTVQTPSGGYFSLFHEKDDTAADLPGSTGFVCWVDLASTDLDQDAALLKALGFDSEEMAMPNGPYHILKGSPGTKAGAMAQPNPQAPSMWTAWIAVDDVDATIARARSNGGQVMSEAWDAPGVGRMAVLADPAGVVFGVIAQPAS